MTPILPSFRIHEARSRIGKTSRLALWQLRRRRNRCDLPSTSALVVPHAENSYLIVARAGVDLEIYCLPKVVADISRKALNRRIEAIHNPVV